MTSFPRRPTAWILATTVVAGAGLGVRLWAHRDVVPDDCAGNGACEAHPSASTRAALVPGPRVLAFSSATCVACQHMAPIVAAAERICAARDTVLHVSLDEDEGGALATTYDVRSIPAWVSVDADGREVARLVGVQPAEAIEQAIEDVRGVRCARVEEPSPSPSRRM